MARKKINRRGATPEDAVLGKKIRARRNLAKVSQAELGEALGVSFQQIQKYEKGVNRVSATRLQQIADVLKESITYFQSDGRDKSAAGAQMNDLMFDPLNMRMLKAFSDIEHRELKFKVIGLLEFMNHR